jgi:hypothetical protein
VEKWRRTFQRHLDSGRVLRILDYTRQGRLNPTPFSFADIDVLFNQSITRFLMVPVVHHLLISYKSMFHSALL